MLLDEISTYLVSQGVGVAGSTASWTVFKGIEPNTPEKCITLFETGGLENEGHHDTPVDRPTFQVRVRADSYGYSTARVKLGAARTALENIGNITLSSWKYVHVQAIGEAASLGYDENQLPRLVLNFRAIRSRTS